ncbi:MAG: hypothetical protein H6R18_1525 [Proteobacteria bacterium]|nr:hypothetical protein [Pseudomonadota bacterium]
MKEFVSIFEGWLGVDNLHKLDEVNECDWEKFNRLIVLISEKYSIQLADCERKTCTPVSNVKPILQTFAQALEKDSSLFTKLVIPELDCVLTEDWDYTFIVWHKNNGAVEALKPLFVAAGLYNFHDQSSPGSFA